MSAARSARTGSSSLTRPPAEGRGHCGGGRARQRASGAGPRSRSCAEPTSTTSSTATRQGRRESARRPSGSTVNRRRPDGRDKANLDIFWLRDESLEDTDNLPAPGVIAAEIVEDLQSALAEFTELAESLHGIDVEIEEEHMDTEVRTPQLVVMQPQRSSCRFQRPYVWNQENQWGPLWRDVTSAPPFAAVCRWPAGVTVGATDGPARGPPHHGVGQRA